MKNKIKASLSVLVGISALAGISLHATPATVTENGLGSSDGVSVNSSTLGDNLNTSAGTIKLAVTQGAQTSNVIGFCIDPWNFSSGSPLTYSIVAVANAPQTEGPMGAGAATQIGQLWAQYMTSAYALSSTASTADAWATALQLEIWQTVANSITNPAYTYSLNSVANNYPGEAAAVASDEAAMATFLTNNPNAVTADLEALDSPTAQDYVIADLTPSVPDSGSIAGLVAVGMLGLLVFNKRMRLA
jgi:hypothetical protein